MYRLRRVLGLLALLVSMSAWSGNNVAYRDGQVRFTVISPGAMRMEYVPDGKFVDAQSQVAVCRDYPAVEYQVRTSGKTVVIRTSRLELRYRKGSGAFTADNLSVRVRVPGFKTVYWQPGTKDEGNLKGTYRTLDGYDGNMKDGKPMPVEDGLLSRSGWTLIDDSRSYLFDHSDWPWVTDRPERGRTQDWYFMGYGHDYEGALRDFTLFSGKVPLPPRYAFGYWWSRYWSYSDDELRTLVRNFHDYDIPLDVLVIDMDWHYNQPPRGGWTGYTWNRGLFPDPQAFLKWVKSEGLKVTMNLHPADGVKTWEEHWPEMSQWMGVDTALHRDIPYEGSDKRMMSGWIATQLRPLEKAGVDFWWLDWQQGLNDRKYSDLSNTWWLNYVMFSDMECNRETRPMLYHRWGGLGNHRYQIGFSGDSRISWKSLDFQPWFNATASNVLYGYWSHDIGGHWGGDHIDPELYIRWMQFGLFSPILRTHSTKNSGLNKEPWQFAYDEMEQLRGIIRRRYELVPYIYTMARKTYDEALPLCRPLYYAYPEAPESYREKNEYLFGDNFLVDPVTAPMDSGKAVKSTWLPKGLWYEVSSGTLLEGGQTVRQDFHLDEMPVYVKAGSILPMYGDSVRNLNGNDEPVIATVFPSPDSSAEGNFYEDAGNDKYYAKEYATTRLTSTCHGNRLTVTVSARKGYYRNMPSHRRWTLRVIASAVPEKVLVNGREVPFTYDGMDLSLWVSLPETNCFLEKKVEVQYPDGSPFVADGTLGRMRRIRQNVLVLKQHHAGIVLTDDLAEMESAGRAMSYAPQDFRKLLDQFRNRYGRLRGILESQQLKGNEIQDFLRKTW